MHDTAPPPAPSPLAAIPSVDRLLSDPALEPLVARHGRGSVKAALQAALQALRAEIAAGDAPAAAPTAQAIAGALAARMAAERAASLRPVLNLTGTVLHTNLGRAPLAPSAVAAMVAVAGACNLEFDLEPGTRGERDRHVERLVVALTGAESALVVNNNAAAVFLVLNTLAARRDVIVSRGELVEIGGQFRVPDIMARAGARLREVGTTNRTHPSDYADAIGPRTALLMKVHPSNYEVRGFTRAVDAAEVVRIGRERGVTVVSDLGSGTLLDLRRWGLPAERTVREEIDAGVDLVTFSGDKLLGGPQCGVVAGRRALVDALRRNPLKRALRVDKLVLAALEQTLLLHLDPDRLAETSPSLRLLTRPPEAIRPVAEAVRAALAAVLPAPYEASTVDCASQIGSGALPVDTLPSVGVRIASRAAKSRRGADARRLAAALRALPVPVVGRVDGDAVILDCRCLEAAAPLVDQLGRLALDPAR